jgi:hypothetical protein
MIIITSNNAASGEEDTATVFTPEAIEMNTARGSYTVTAHAQSAPPLGSALLALTELVIHIETGRRRGAIHRHYADRLVVDIDRIAGALNVLAWREAAS